MNISEKNIEDVIYDCLKANQKFQLVKRGLEGLRPYAKFFRQLNLGSYGRADLIGLSYDQFHKSFNICVIEIKKGTSDYSAFMQAIRYCKAIERYLDTINMEALFKIILIGNNVCQSDFCYISDFVTELEIYSVSLDLDKGINFKREGGYYEKNERLPIIPEDTIETIKEYVKGTIRDVVFNDEPF